MPTDCLKTRPTVTQRALHQRTHGTPRSVYRRSARKGLRPICTAHLRIARRAGAQNDLRAYEGRHAKRKGQKFGLQLRSKAAQRRFTALSMAAVKKAAMGRAEACRLHIEWALRQPGANGRPISFGAAAEKLNERNIQSVKGARWWGTQVKSMATRLGLNPPRPRLCPEAARPYVNAVWKKQPHFTVTQVIRSLAPTVILGERMTSTLLSECRHAAAKRVPVPKRLEWRIDRRTPARMPVRAVWEQHPEFTAKQVIQKLGPGQEDFVQLGWVPKVLKQCWRASGSHRPKKWLTGRRLYHRPPRAQRCQQRVSARRRAE